VKPDHFDFLVVGGGVIGISVARALRRRHTSARICLLEKESAPGAHASGRNSGVLHAGFYYTADSLKARFCREGNRELREYILSRGLALNPCGKLVVAKDATELPRLDELLRRGTANGVRLEMVDAAHARRIEPRVRTHERALWSPDTATADPAEVIRSMRSDAEREGIRIRCDASYLGRTEEGVRSAAGEFRAGYVVNCAGLQADRVALDFGFSKDYRILPFKGLYLYSDEETGSFRTNIYPVPDLRNPFLGVHFTVTVDGHAKIGPTAIPAFWREQYSGFDRFDAAECLEIGWRDLGLLLFAGFDFRRLAYEELRKYSRSHLARLASVLAEGVRPENYRRWGKPGIRAQLMHLPTRKLEMDFVLQGDSRSFHVLNAVSPAWTCSLPFAEHIVDCIGHHRR
jgi:L-2-hydroxyglutarate oxidase LhgO